MCLYKRHKCLKVKTICTLNGFSLSLCLKTFNLSNSSLCVKQVGSSSTVNHSSRTEQNYSAVIHSVCQHRWHGLESCLHARQTESLRRAWMSGSRQQLDKISISDIQLMSTVPFLQPFGRRFYPWTGRSEHSVTKRRSCPSQSVVSQAW